MMRFNIPRAFSVTAGSAELERHRLPIGWRAGGYAVAIVPFGFLLALAWLDPDFNRPATPDWQPLLAQAEAAWDRGNVHEARHLYGQVDRIAAWRQDWRGLVAAACGIKKVDGARGVNSKAFQILVRALIAAQHRQSRDGVAAVASVFNALGEPKAAAMVLAQIRSDWPEEATDPSRVAAASC
jgi:hypothetical protein